MKLTELLAGLSRAPWQSAARPILIRAGIDTSVGPAKTVAALTAKPPTKAEQDALVAGLTEHTVAGEKYVQFVQLQSGERAALDAWINSKRVHKNELTDAFPGLVPESVAVPYHTQDPTSAGSRHLQSGIAAIYTATRSYVHAEPIPPSSLSASAAGGFERIVGYRNKFLQTYDAIWLPPSGNYVVLAVDYPEPGPKQAFPLAGSAFLLKVLRQQLGRPLKIGNLWHAVEGLYQAHDGKLVDYGFSVGGQSVNHHRARKKTAVCLRKAVYDAGGAAAVQAAGKYLELFKVAMQWTLKAPDNVITSPEVLIPGLARDLNKALPVVNHCIVRGCLTSRELEFVVSKVAPHITKWV